jgi:hypothetical protein
MPKHLANTQGGTATPGPEAMMADGRMRTSAIRDCAIANDVRRRIAGKPIFFQRGDITLYTGPDILIFCGDSLSFIQTK